MRERCVDGKVDRWKGLLMERCINGTAGSWRGGMTEREANGKEKQLIPPGIIITDTNHYWPGGARVIPTALGGVGGE